MTKRTAIVTGVSSFVGMHLAHAFASTGWRVVAVTSRPQSDYKGIRSDRLAAISNQVIFSVCDLTDGDAVGELVLKHKPDLWVQHAGYTDNYHSMEYNLEASLALNVLALEPLYQHLSKTECGVIVTGSGMEYSTSDEADSESDVCWPDLPYGVSKLAETVEAHRLAEQYGVPTRVARLYIPVGIYDAPGKLIDLVIRALAKGVSTDLSPCTQKRDFLGVRDLCMAYLKLADDFGRQTFDIFNVCSGKAWELKSVLLELCRIMDADESLLNFGAFPMRPGEPMVSYGDNNKAKQVLDWEPQPIEKVLKALVTEIRLTA